MPIYIVTAIMFLVILVNYYLGEKLYKLPNDKKYFNNVTNVDISKEREIGAKPTYVVLISAVTGILLGLYLAYASIKEVHGIVITIMTILVFVCYLIELTRRVSFKDGTLILSRFLGKTKVIDATRITGMYIYSYNKKFLKKHAFTTKLVICESNGNKTKFTLSSIDNRSVLNLMKDGFGIQNNKMYIANKVD